MKKVIIIAALALVACKKQTIAPAAPKPAEVAKTYNYTASVIINQDQGSYGDTLIIKLNGTVKAYMIGAQVSPGFTFTCKSGDKLSVYYNPGKIPYGQSVIIAQNDLNVYFNDADNFNPYTFNFGGCRCVGVYNNSVK